MRRPLKRSIGFPKPSAEPESVWTDDVVGLNLHLSQNLLFLELSLALTHQLPSTESLAGSPKLTFQHFTN